MDLSIIFSLIGGLVFLIIGAEGLIRGTSAIALRSGISPLVVGLTVVAFGTSSPELLVSIKSSLDGAGDIALGNIIGSNISNIALVIGLSAIIKPMLVQNQVVKREIPIMIGVTILLTLFLIDQNISRIEGIFFFIGIIFYIIISIYLSKKENVPAEFPGNKKKPLKNIYLSILLVIAGLGLLILGANLFVDGAVKSAEKLGVSQAVIGLTIVAIGTSLPELVTSIVATIKNEVDIAIGNIVGSNVFNILLILGITAIVKPIISVGINFLDISIMLFTSIILLPLSFTGFKINRWEGIFLFTGYSTYIIYLIT